MGNYNILLDNGDMGYYIVIYYKYNEYEDEYRTDVSIANLMGMSLKYYINLMKTNFGDKIILIHNSIFIPNKKDILEIKKWFEENIMSYILLKELNPNISFN